VTSRNEVPTSKGGREWRVEREGKRREGGRNRIEGRDGKKGKERGGFATSEQGRCCLKL